MNPGMNPLTIQQAKDEVQRAKTKCSFEDEWPAEFDRIISITDEAAELYRQSFIDSLREKIEQAVIDAELTQMHTEYIRGLDKAAEILTLLKSGETGK